MNKTVLFVVALILVLLTGVGGGGWYYLSTQKDLVKTESSKQAESLGKVNERIQAVTTIYQQLGEQKSEQPVRVLGAQTPANNRQQDILQKSQQVLGIEDSETLQKSRDIIEIITQSEEELKKLNSGLNRISSIGGLSLFSQMNNLELPISQTQTFHTQITPILEVIKSAEQIGIEAHKTGYDLGASLAIALQRADEDSIKKLEEKISALDALVSQEAALSQKDIPTELKSILQATNAQSVQVVSGFRDLPAIIRRRDVLALQKAITDMQVNTVVESEKIKVDFVSFLRNNETIRSAATLQDQWREVNSSL
jgi:hypothetical protein